MLRSGRVERSVVRWLFLLVPAAILVLVFSSSGSRDDQNLGRVVRSKEIGSDEGKTIPSQPKQQQQEVKKATPLTHSPLLPTRETLKSVGSCSSSSQSQFRFADDGRKCILPFRLQNAWHDSCDIGLCAVRVDTLSRASELANCSTRGYQGGKLSCVTTKSSGKCSDRSQVSAVTCDDVIGGRNSFGVCVCTTATGEVVTSTVDCEERTETTCNDICRRMQDDITSSSYSSSMANQVPEVIVTLSQLASTKKPTDNNDINAWKEYAAALPELSQLSTKWCGRGIAMFVSYFVNEELLLDVLSVFRQNKIKKQNGRERKHPSAGSSDGFVYPRTFAFYNSSGGLIRFLCLKYLNGWV